MITLDKDELVKLTGLTQPRRQVDELRARGFWRARLVHGETVLERAHFEAVCAGAVAPGTQQADHFRPRLRAIPKPATA